MRRIQETWRDPVTGNGSQGGQNQNGGGGPVTYADTTEREYVHSPGYVDELVCEVDTGGAGDTFWWVLQDANYNVVALVSDGDGSLLRGQVARQYAWSPYGELVRAEVFDSAAPMSRLGHQGLFHDRLDAGVTSEPMVAFGAQLVQNRNRTLSPRLGRFLQRDPNGTALVAFNALDYHGLEPSDGLALDVRAMFGDGSSLYQCVGGNPIRRVDPAGLYFSLPSLLGQIAMEAGETAHEMLTNRGANFAAQALTDLFATHSLDQQLMFDTILDWDTLDSDLGGVSLGGSPASDREWAQAGKFKPWRDATGKLIRWHNKGTLHADAVLKLADRLNRKNRGRTRMNQALVDTNDSTIKIGGKALRPDVWVFHPRRGDKGGFELVEVVNAQSPAAAANKIQFMVHELRRLGYKAEGRVYDVAGRQLYP